MQISIKHNFPEVARQLKTLQREVGEKALASAVNKTLRQARTGMTRAITQEFAVKAKVVRESLNVRLASRKAGLFAIEGTLESPSKRGRARNLIHFAARQGLKGVTFKVKRKGPRKLIPGAFIAKRGNKYGGVVFIRQGKKRLPIEARQTIDTAQMFNTRRIKRVVINSMQDKFPATFENEARFYLARFNSGSTR